MNFCGLSSIDQECSIVCQREEMKDCTLYVSATEVPKTPLNAGRTYSFHGATPSPSLLNPISDEDWNDSKSRRSIFCPKLPSPKSSELLLQSLKAGYRVTLYVQNYSHTTTLSLDEDLQSLRVTGVSLGIVGPDADEKKGDESFVVRISNIIRLDIGIVPRQTMTRPIVERVNPLTCFSLATKEPIAKCHKLEFSTFTVCDRETILAALSIVLKPDRQERPMLHPRLPPVESQIAPRKSPRYDQFMNECNAPIQSSPKHPVSERALRALKGDDLSKRTRIYTSTPPRQVRASTEARTPRDQGTELALIDLSDSDDQMLGSEDRPSQDELAVPYLKEDDNDTEDVDENGWFGPPQRDLVARGSSLSLWCTDDICSGALKDIAQTFQGIFIHTSSPNNAEEFADKRQEVENYIAYILGAPQPIVPNASEDRSKSGTDAKPDAAVVNPNFRNRISLLDAPAKRWQQLNSEMTFSSAMERSKQHMQVVQTTKSMDDIEGLLYMQRAQPAKPSFFDATVYLSALVDQLLPDELPRDEETICYYDSDQDDVRPRKLRGQCSRAVAETMMQPDDGGSLLLDRNRITFQPRRVVRQSAEEDVLNVVDVMKTTILTLLWHPNPDSKNRSKPLCVEAWIERGTYLSTMAYIQPKFMWKNAYESRLELERKVNVGLTKPEHIDLLEISRVQDDVTIDRSTHPLAQSKTCFSITTLHATFIFQAQTVHEKNQIVYGLKLTVARLASLLMTRDMKAVQEFFEPVSAHVPGQAPEWTK